MDERWKKEDSQGERCKQLKGEKSSFKSEILIVVGVAHLHNFLGLLHALYFALELQRWLMEFLNLQI